MFSNVTLFDLGNGLNVGPDGNALSSRFRTSTKWSTTLACQRKHTIKVRGEYRLVYFTPRLLRNVLAATTSTRDPSVLEDLAPDNFGQRGAGSSTYYGNQKAVYWYVNELGA
jgi:hypothetical protein